MFMVASVFRHTNTGPLRGESNCQTVWANFLYINNFVWNYAADFGEAFEKYGGGVSKNLKKNIYCSNSQSLIYPIYHLLFSVSRSNLVHGK